LDELMTKPLRFSELARLYTKGLKPTPWTMPLTDTRVPVLFIFPGIKKNRVQMLFSNLNPNQIISKTLAF